MQKITPFFWFDSQAEEAAKFYISIFKNSKINSIARYAEGNHGEPGSVMTVAFTIEGQEFTALNGGPVFHINEAVSFVVNCETQAEVDDLWERLSADGEKSQCGWLKDKFGVSWQIVPTILGKLMQAEDPIRAQRVTKAMLQMTKLDIAVLQRAYDQE